MAKTAILLKAKANKLGIDGYRKMSVPELEAAIAKAEGKATAPVKGKSPAKGRANGAKGKGKARKAVTRAVKGKGKSTSAPAKRKSKGQKSSQAKGRATAAKGKAKRPTATKGKTAKTRTRKAALVGRVDIDRSKIDWKVESNVGRTGKRGDVMAALRKHKGDYDKVFDALADKARKFYPSKDKHGAERMLRWLINRVAFDFVMVTGQHTPGTRAAYGTSTAAQDIRRREEREAARKAAKRAARGTAKRGSAKPKSAKRSTGKGKGRTAKGRK